MLKNLSRILPFFIVTLLCIGGVELLYGVAEHYLLFPASKTTVSETLVTVSAKPVKKLEKHKNYEVILDRNLFQSYTREPEKIEPVNENPLEGLEATSLSLVLMGTISGPNDSGRAIIMEKAKKKQDIYYRGDIVQGAEIKEILRGKVILTFQGKDEILDMTEANKYKPRQSAAVAPVPTRKRVVRSPRTKSRTNPLRLKTRKAPTIQPKVEEPEGESDNAEPVAEQDNEPVEQNEESESSNQGDGPAEDSETNDREQS
jgi:type II secretory pathway component PulC